METFNECTLLVLGYFLMCFTDFVPEAEARSELGEYYNYITYTNICVHLIFMIRSAIITIKLRLRRRGGLHSILCCVKRTTRGTKSGNPAPNQVYKVEAKPIEIMKPNEKDGEGTAEKALRLGGIILAADRKRLARRYGMVVAKIVEEVKEVDEKEESSFDLGL